MPEQFTVLACRAVNEFIEFRTTCVPASRRTARTSRMNAGPWTSLPAGFTIFRSTTTTRKALPEDRQWLGSCWDNRGSASCRSICHATSLYEPIVAQLGAVNMAHPEDGWRRIVVEKPFATI